MDNKQIEELKKRVESQKETAHIYVPYSKRIGTEPDFEVDYEVDLDKDLKDIKLHQGMRCDFLYEGDDPLVDGVHMIWPELLDDNRDIILDNTVMINSKGSATMWVLMNESKQEHQKRIKVGTKGYWVVGSKKIANIVVTKINQ